eukprot:g22007.t1
MRLRPFFLTSGFLGKHRQKQNRRPQNARRRQASRRSTLADTQTLEARLVLAGTYGFDVIASTAVDAGSVSVNDFGDVTYMQSQRAYVSDGSGPVAVNSPIPDANLFPNPQLQINNAGQVAETTTGVGPGNPRADLWHGVTAPESGDRIALGAPAVFYFKDIAPVSSLSNDGQMAFAGHNGLVWEVHLSDSRVDTFSPDTLVTTLSTGTDFNLMAAEGDRVVVGSESGGIETVELFDITGNDTSTVIASSASPLWNEVGISPGISDSGSVVVFYGDLTQNGATLFGVLAGPGIFASIPTGPSIGDRTIIRMDGDLGRTTGGAQINFSSFDVDGRVNIVHQEYGRVGMTDDALIASYIATPSAASPAGAANDPLVFTANTGIFASHVDIYSLAARDIRPSQPLRVVQVGDTLSADTVTAVSLNDSLATPLENPNGVSILPRRGDHYLAFQADTATGLNLAVRGNYIDPNLDAAATPPRKTQLTGPVLLADDLTPTVTWANLPNVAVDFWEVLGYHILSGRQVIDLNVVGSQTAITLPTATALGTHEFWIRGHNGAGAEPWAIEHRLYFHVVAPNSNPTSVEITGPVSNVLDDTPHISWDQYPGGVTYDALVYSVTRGVEVARFEGVVGSSFELPRLPTQDVYAVHMRANTIFSTTTHWSRAHVFRIDASSTPLPNPTNIAPTSRVNNNQPVFTWDPIPGAWIYETRIEAIPNGPVIATGVVNNAIYPTPAPLGGGPYLFYVRALNDALEATDWVNGLFYIVSADQELRDLDEVEPTDDAATGGLPRIPAIDPDETVPVVFVSDEHLESRRDTLSEQEPIEHVTVETPRPVAAPIPYATLEQPPNRTDTLDTEAGPESDHVFIEWSDSDHAAGFAGIVALCARRHDLLLAAQQEDGAELATDDWRQVVEHPDINLVVVATPDARHHEAVMACVEHGKHVVCEKPVGFNVAEAFEMWNAVREAKLAHFVPFWTRYVPVFRRARKLVQEGMLGEVRAAICRWHNPRPAAMPFTWRDDSRHSSAGSIADVGSHAYDTLRWILGENAVRVLAHADVVSPAKPHLGDIHLGEAIAWGGAHDRNDAHEIRKGSAFDYADIAFEMESGSVGSLVLSHAPFLRKGFAPEMELHGTAGSLAVDRNAGTVKLLCENGDTEVLNEPTADQLDCRFGSFVFPALEAQLAGTDCDFPGLDDGCRAQLFTDAAAESAKQGCWIELADVTPESI